MTIHTKRAPKGILYTPGVWYEQWGVFEDKQPKNIK